MLYELTDAEHWDSEVMYQARQLANSQGDDVIPCNNDLSDDEGWECLQGALTYSKSVGKWNAFNMFSEPVEVRILVRKSKH